MSEEIERALWNVLRPTGEPVEVAGRCVNRLGSLMP